MSDHNKRKKSVANLTLVVNGFHTEVQLLPCEKSEPDAPKLQARHDCGNEVALVLTCGTCGEVQHKSAPQQSGNALGKAGTGKKPELCSKGHNLDDIGEEAAICPKCNNTKVDKSALKKSLTHHDHVVDLTEEQFEDWLALRPPSGKMIPRGLVPVNTIPAIMRREIYEIVPKKGSERRTALWLTYLKQKQLALIVRFAIKKSFKVGMLYAPMINGQPKLFVQLLIPNDQLDLEQFTLPDIDGVYIDRLDTLLRPLRQVSFDDAVSNPQTEAFIDLFARGVKTIRPLSVQLGENEALAAQLSADLSPAAPPPKEKAPRTRKPRP